MWHAMATAPYDGDCVRLLATVCYHGYSHIPLGFKQTSRGPTLGSDKFIACSQSSATVVLSNSMDDLVLSLSQQSIARGVHT